MLLLQQQQMLLCGQFSSGSMVQQVLVRLFCNGCFICNAGVVVSLGQGVLVLSVTAVGIGCTALSLTLQKKHALQHLYVSGRFV